MYRSLGFRLDSSDMFGPGDHAPACQIRPAIARRRLECVEAPTRLGHNHVRLDPESRK
jgi:hypothetical protein